MSQEDLAKAANVDVKTVRDFELGKRWPWSQTRSAIARALQVPTLVLQVAADGEPIPDVPLPPVPSIVRRAVRAYAAETGRDEQQSRGA